jgi:dolichyl-phosphate beta-glucosyltransferase
MTQLDLSIIIPVFNEHTKVVQDIQQASEFLTASGLQGEILIVDDGSTDQSSEVASHTPVPESVTCRVITLETNCGKGHAVRTGIIASKGQHILFADSGCCIPFAQAKTGLDLIQQEGCVLAVGSRRHPKSIIHRDQSFKRRLYSRAFRTLLDFLFPSLRPLHDTQCGFKAFSAKAAEKIFSVARIDGWGFDIEALALARNFGYRANIIPARWIDHADTHVRIWNYGTTLLETVQVRYNLLTGAYDADPDPVQN